jgi:hypothetical protein
MSTPKQPGVERTVPSAAAATEAAIEAVEVIHDTRNPDSPGATIVVKGVPVIRITKGDGESDETFQRFVTNARLAAAETAKALTPPDPLG